MSLDSSFRRLEMSHVEMSHTNVIWFHYKYYSLSFKQ